MIIEKESIHHIWHHSHSTSPCMSSYTSAHRHILAYQPLEEYLNMTGNIDLLIASSASQVHVSSHIFNTEDIFDPLMARQWLMYCT